MSEDSSSARTALVVEDHPMMRDALVNVLAEAGFDVIHSAATVPEAIAAYGRQRPDLVLADLRLEETSDRGRGREGIELARQLVEADPNAVVVIVSGRNGGGLVQQGLDAGAVGWVSKRADARELVEVLGDALRGVRGAHDRDTYRQLLNGVPVDPQEAAGLSPREMDVLEAMARGATTTAELAAALHISEDTVKTHMGMVLSKLEVPSRAAAIVRAHQMGLVHSRRDD